MRTPAFRRSVAAIAASLLTIGTSPLASAHDSVIDGNPANGEQLQEFPTEIALEFSGYVKEDFNTFAVSNADTKEVLFSGEPTVDERWVSMAVPEGIDPGPGNYRIGFQITSSDGHATRGMTEFSVAGAEPSLIDETPAEHAAAPEEGSASVPWAWVIGGLVLVVAVVGGIAAAAARSRK